MTKNAAKKNGHEPNIGHLNDFRMGLAYSILQSPHQEMVSKP